MPLNFLFRRPRLAALTMPMVALLVGGTVASVAALARGQQQQSRAAEQQNQQQQMPTFSANVKGVNVLANVRDKKGQIISNLGKDDFAIEEDGRLQTIRYFTRETDLPLTLGLLVDTSLSQRRVLEEERTASYSFLSKLLREDKDTAFVAHFDAETELLQEQTSSRQKLEAALQLLETPEFGRSGGRRGGGSSGGGSPGGGGRGGSGDGGRIAAGTVLYDAVYVSSNELMKKQQGRKAFIILSDGVDTGSKTSIESAIAAAQRSDTLIYSILFKDDEAYGGGGFGGPFGGGMGRGGRRGGGMPMPQRHPDGKKVLQRLSQETGGRFFEVSKKHPIEEIYASIQEELRNQYSIGYTPDHSDANASYHTVKLTTKQKDLQVQTRDKYYAAN